MHLVGLEKTSFFGGAFLALTVATLVLGGVVAWTSANPLLRAAAVLGWLVSAGIATLLSKGGMRGERNTARPVATVTS